MPSILRSGTKRVVVSAGPPTVAYGAGATKSWCMYKKGEFQDKQIGSHDINYNKPIVWDQSRSKTAVWTGRTSRRRSA